MENNKNITIVCYGVRKSEEYFFNKLNKDYNYNLKFIESFEVNEENMKLAKGADALMLRESVYTNFDQLKKFKEYGVKYLLTRTAGFDHINLDDVKKLGFHSLQRVPAYSPNAIGELSVGFALTLLRRIQYTTLKSHNGDFTIDENMLAKEIRNCKVGIIGTGKIGYVTATLYKGLGAEIIGYDPYPNDMAKKILEYKSLDDLLKESDIISIHCPLLDSTKNIICENSLKKVKDDVVIINVARGGLVNVKDITEFLKNNPKASFAADVITHEEKFFFKDMKNSFPKEIEEINKLFPRFLVTPHVGASTDEALKNTIETSFSNLNDALNNKELKNNLI